MDDMDEKVGHSIFMNFLCIMKTEGGKGYQKSTDILG